MNSTATRSRLQNIKSRSTGNKAEFLRTAGDATDTRTDSLASDPYSALDAYVNSQAKPFSGNRLKERPARNWNGQTKSASATRRSHAVRELLLTSSGRVGATILSLACFLSVTTLYGISGSWTYETLAALLLIRTVYFLVREPKPVLSSYGIRKSANGLFIDETIIGITLLAASFLMSWPAHRLALLSFLGCNFILQFFLM